MTRQIQSYSELYRGRNADIRKMFQNASSLKPLGELKPNCPGMIIGRSSVFYADRKSAVNITF
jgi:hypothetical protein